MNKRLHKRTKIFSIVIVLLIIISILLFVANKSSFKTEEQLAKTRSIQRMLENDMITEEVLNEDNSQYDFIQNGNGNIILMEYAGDEDCVVVSKELEGNKITKINPGAFINNDNLEMIKIPTEISDNIDEIDGFEVSGDLSNDEYIVYVTTKEYTESYLEYINLSNEERKKVEVIPFKFVISENENLEKTRKVTATYASIPSSFDLRNSIKITVENQGDFGICYAYASIKSAETNVALTKGKVMDFSEIHLAVKSEQFYGAEMDKVITKYWSRGYGPVVEKPNTLLSQSYLDDALNRYYDSIAMNIYKACVGEKTLTEQEKNDAVNAIDKLKPIPDFYVLKRNSFQISGLDKLDNSKESEVTEERNAMKDHIQKYGSLAICIADPNNTSVCKKYGKYMVMNAKKRK